MPTPSPLIYISAGADGWWQHLANGTRLPYPHAPVHDKHLVFAGLSLATTGHGIYQRPAHAVFLNPAAIPVIVIWRRKNHLSCHPYTLKLHITEGFEDAFLAARQQLCA
ncbi:MAG: hypothetical protein WAX89_07640 [Alphaproteobacteria bacterium]